MSRTPPVWHEPFCVLSRNTTMTALFTSLSAVTRTLFHASNGWIVE